VSLMMSKILGEKQYTPLLMRSLTYVEDGFSVKRSTTV
jgi:hypothetical protein